VGKFSDLNENDQKGSVGKFSDLNENDQKDYEFASRQLDIVDSKANNILLVDSILIVISTLSLLFSEKANLVTRIIGTVAVIVTLISIAFCTRTMKIDWSDSFSINELKKERDRRTKNIHYSLWVLVGALVLYVLMFVVDLILNIL
jgi:hypothetical protein